MKLKLISPMPPSVNHYLKHTSKGGHLHVYVTAEGKKYKSDFAAYVKSEIIKQGWDFPINKYQHFYVDMVFYFNRIDMDASNYDKCLLDAITDTQLIWVDDNVVVPRVNRIYYTKDDPYIELEIYPVEYIGIFDNLSQLNNFEAKCMTCNRYNRNCSIFARACLGFVQEDIVNNKCAKYREMKKKKNKRS